MALNTQVIRTRWLESSNIFKDPKWRFSKLRSSMVISGERVDLSRAIIRYRNPQDKRIEKKIRSRSESNSQERVRLYYARTYISRLDRRAWNRSELEKEIEIARSSAFREFSTRGSSDCIMPCTIWPRKRVTVTRSWLLVDLLARFTRESSSF